MINKNIENEIVAEAIRVEIDSDKNEVYIVFQIFDETLKSRIKKDWTQDIEFKLIGKKLILNKG